MIKSNEEISQRVNRCNSLEELYSLLEGADDCHELLCVPERIYKVEDTEDYGFAVFRPTSWIIEGNSDWITSENYDIEKTNKVFLNPIYMKRDGNWDGIVIDLENKQLQSYRYAVEYNNYREHYKLNERIDCDLTERQLDKLSRLVSERFDSPEQIQQRIENSKIKILDITSYFTHVDSPNMLCTYKYNPKTKMITMKMQKVEINTVNKINTVNTWCFSFPFSNLNHIDDAKRTLDEYAKFDIEVLIPNLREMREGFLECNTKYSLFETSEETELWFEIENYKGDFCITLHNNVEKSELRIITDTLLKSNIDLCIRYALANSKFGQELSKTYSERCNKIVENQNDNEQKEER